MTGSSERTINVLRQLGYDPAVSRLDPDDVKIVKYVAAIVGLRAAQLVAINTAQLLNRIGDDDEVVAGDGITIAIDGSVYKHHPRLKSWLEGLIAQYAPGRKVCARLKLYATYMYTDFYLSIHFVRQFKLMLAEDGSGKGAGLAAAIAARLKARN